MLLADPLGLCLWGVHYVNVFLSSAYGCPLIDNAGAYCPELRHHKGSTSYQYSITSKD